MANFQATLTRTRDPPMPCLLALMALAVPRLVIAAIWVFSGWFQGIFAGLLWPVLGFIFAPVTLLWFTAVHN